MAMRMPLVMGFDVGLSSRNDAGVRRGLLIVVGVTATASIGLAAVAVSYGRNGLEAASWIVGIGSGLLSLPALWFAMREREASSVDRAIAGTGYSTPGSLNSPTVVVDRLPAVPPVALKGLPRDSPHFTNRSNALKRIREASRKQQGDLSAIVLIDGMAGVGKTALAVHAAHKAATIYPDAQLYIDLHAHSRGRGPSDSSSALETLLRVLGVPATEIPDSLDGRSALWRSLLAGRRVVLVIDNVANSQQLKPLLPSSGACLVLITSRRHLVDIDGAFRIGLEVLSSDDAFELFTRITDTEYSDTDRAEIRSVVERCAFLPIAIALCASRLRHRPVWRPSHLANELREGKFRLDGAWTEAKTVESVFETSYLGLAAEERRAFRLFSLHPPQEFGIHAVAALADENLFEMRRHIEELYSHNLLQEPQVGRYLVHDLLHEYALQRTEREDPAAIRETAIDRMLDYYTFMAVEADRLIDLLGNRPAEVEWVPAEKPELNSHTDAMAWMELERENLHFGIRLAISTGRKARATRLARATIYFLRLKGYWSDVLDLCESLADVCADIDHRDLAADFSFYSGDVHRLTGRYGEALREYQIAVSSYRTVSDRHREARTLHSIGDVQRAQGRHADALARYDEALSIYLGLENPLAAARAFHSIGDTQKLQENYSEALVQYGKALPTYEAMDDRVGKARILQATSDISLRLGDAHKAHRGAAAALEEFRALGDILGEADSLFCLGEVYRAQGDDASSVRYYKPSLDLYRALGDKQSQLRALRRMGQALIALGRIDEGNELLREAEV